MLDLFAGLGGASEPFRKAGWDVVRVELDLAFEAEIHADIASFRWTGRRPTLVWASPPCTEFSRESMPWCRTGRTPDLSLVHAARRVIAECDPDWWVIENVKGASRYLTPMFGRPRVFGPVSLWGEFPRFAAKVRPWKERLSSTQRARRAEIPFAIGDGLRRAIEADVFFGAKA
ncbi:MAG TPA: DNA cytosine methyltransferase [Tepidisphaeraceae bacterium]|nr:DNA cytosine methyltransferase [Tepidisphaeraceae bacterium]